ncbi:NYN domain-containing protein [Legionella genomosp. 1]|uniref:NYN domain-containing protein n=1 Tax=Legionella genomosp. 1 TaxID=1093625 RepID=UPI001055916D|nr:NYN domain-containing protein [Legionella genomosp. 1]
MNEPNTSKLAVLIDADNASASNIEYLINEISRYGEIIVNRIYGDFTLPNNSQWRKVLQKYSIKPIQQFRNTVGKNASDSALIIDAMDLLYTQKLNGFCIVSSDSDFTGLATRIREEGLKVYGFGEEKTPESFRNSCNKFISIELLQPKKIKTVKTKKNAGNSDTTKKSDASTFPKEFIIEALDNSYDDSGWAYISVFGSYLAKLKPDFDSRRYGYKKLSDLVKGKTDIFDIDERVNPASNTKELFIRAKE